MMYKVDFSQEDNFKYFWEGREFYFTLKCVDFLTFCDLEKYLYHPSPSKEFLKLLFWNLNHAYLSRFFASMFNINILD